MVIIATIFINRSRTAVFAELCVFTVGHQYFLKAKFPINYNCFQLKVLTSWILKNLFHEPKRFQGRLSLIAYPRRTIIEEFCWTQFSVHSTCEALGITGTLGQLTYMIIETHILSR